MSYRAYGLFSPGFVRTNGRAITLRLKRAPDGELDLQLFQRTAGGARRVARFAVEVEERRFRAVRLLEKQTRPAPQSGVTTVQLRFEGFDGGEELVFFDEARALRDADLRAPSSVAAAPRATAATSRGKRWLELDFELRQQGRLLFRPSRCCLLPLPPYLWELASRGDQRLVVASDGSLRCGAEPPAGDAQRLAAESEALALLAAGSGDAFACVDDLDLLELIATGLARRHAADCRAPGTTGARRAAALRLLEDVARRAGELACSAGSPLRTAPRSLLTERLEAEPYRPLRDCAQLRYVHRSHRPELALRDALRAGLLAATPEAGGSDLRACLRSAATDGPRPGLLAALQRRGFELESDGMGLRRSSGLRLEIAQEADPRALLEGEAEVVVLEARPDLAEALGAEPVRGGGRGTLVLCLGGRGTALIDRLRASLPHAALLSTAPPRTDAAAARLLGTLLEGLASGKSWRELDAALGPRPAGPDLPALCVPAPTESLERRWESAAAGQPDGYARALDLRDGAAAGGRLFRAFTWLRRLLATERCFAPEQARALGWRPDGVMLGGFCPPPPDGRSFRFDANARIGKLVVRQSTAFKRVPAAALAAMLAFEAGVAFGARAGLPHAERVALGLALLERLASLLPRDAQRDAALLRRYGLDAGAPQEVAVDAGEPRCFSPEGFAAVCAALATDAARTASYAAAARLRPRRLAPREWIDEGSSRDLRVAGPA